MSAEQMNPEGIGVVRISDEVISIVSSVAVSEVKGVIGVYDGSKSGIFGLKSLNKGVKAEMKENVVGIEIDIIVEYGANMPEIAWEIQEKVKKSVENMTGLVVDRVNVNIKDIQLKAEEAAPEDPVAPEAEPAQE